MKFPALLAFGWKPVFKESGHALGLIFQRRAGNGLSSFSPFGAAVKWQSSWIYVSLC